MISFLRFLLLSVHLLHFKTTPAVAVEDVLMTTPNATADTRSAHAVNGTAEDALIVNVNASNSRTRHERQLFFDPNVFLMQSNLGGGMLGGGSWEGAHCLTAGGQQGVCVRIANCRQYIRAARQLTFIAVRQWPPLGFTNAGGDLCNFYDQLGRFNQGICCKDSAAQVPSSITTTMRPQPAVDDEIEDSYTDQQEQEQEQAVAGRPHPPDFQDVNTIESGPATAAPEQPPTPAHPYQWPFGHFAAQWPPPIPTHPPTTGGWPPPIPTHPPNHHYPTHPPVPGAAPTRPTASTTRRTTHRPPATTTRRPSYPGYPSYPTSPPHTTTTTTRRTTPASSGGGAASAEGLPLQCGKRNPVSPDQERIVGGINASPHEFPWMAVLFRSGKQFCGGSLITNNHILTAAHCVARMTSWDVATLTAHLGDYNIRTDFEVQHVERRIKRLVRHKGFDFSTLHNDIAILTLSEPVKFTHEIQPICLPTSSMQQTRSYSGQVATVAGWGSLRENGPQPSILQKVDIPIWSNLECARKYGRAAPGGIIESMICAGQASKDSCSGDSGGPMIVNEGGRYTQVGIVSWGIGCGKGQYPGVYTRTTHLLPWIYKNIKLV